MSEKIKEWCRNALPQTQNLATKEAVVLGVETSCDETAVALYSLKRGLIAEQVYSQTALHADYGGVVPELAARDHIRRLTPMATQLLASEGLRAEQLAQVAYTAGPGLSGGLMVGASWAKGFAYAAGVPALAINHLEGHLMAALLGERAPPLPWLCLLVSGGHSMIVRIDALGCYRVLGESLDDAAGEAFDKSAKVMGLGYPGGAALAALAQHGNPEALAFSRPMLDRPGLDLSFSGLKTALLTALRQRTDVSPEDLAASFQAAVVDTLAAKLARAIKAHEDCQTVILAGGVAANLRLRAKVKALCQANAMHLECPAQAHCTDNAAMIALAGALRWAGGEADTDYVVNVRPRWPLDSLGPPKSVLLSTP